MSPFFRSLQVLVLVCLSFSGALALAGKKYHVFVSIPVRAVSAIPGDVVEKTRQFGGSSPTQTHLTLYSGELHVKGGDPSVAELGGSLKKDLQSHLSNYLGSSHSARKVGKPDIAVEVLEHIDTGKGKSHLIYRINKESAKRTVAPGEAPLTYMKGTVQNRFKALSPQEFSGRSSFHVTLRSKDKIVGAQNLPKTTTAPFGYHFDETQDVVVRITDDSGRDVVLTTPPPPRTSSSGSISSTASTVSSGSISSPAGRH